MKFIKLVKLTKKKKKHKNKMKCNAIRMKTLTYSAGNSAALLTGSLPNTCPSRFSDYLSATQFTPIDMPLHACVSLGN